MILQLNGKEVDTDRALPLTLGDIEDLQTATGLKTDEQGNIQTKCIAEAKRMIHFILKKACPELTLDDIRLIPLRKLNELQAILREEMSAGVPEQARPSSSSPTS